MEGTWSTFYPDSEEIQGGNRFQVEYARDRALSWTMGWWQPSCLYHCRAGAEPSGGYFEPNMQKMNGYWSSGPSKGDVREAKKMIAAAAEAGADCVKLQKSCLKVQNEQEHINLPRISILATKR